MQDDTDPDQLSRSSLAAEVQTLRAERERLTYELGHRVKNTLSMVQALANQTFRGVPDGAEALETFSQRILAIAHANDAILKESWTTVTLGAVADSVLVPGGHPMGPIHIEGAEQRLAAGAALSFALALHELATNAKRHGAWREPGGRVELTWAVTGDAFTLLWRENGGPPAQAPERRGFGLRFAEQSLRSAFGRDVSFAFGPEGLQCRVTAPAAGLEG